MEEVGRRLGSLREDRKLTMTEAADKAELSRRTVYAAERGRNPTLLTLVRLLRVYGALASLETFIPEVEVSPMARLRERKKGSRG